MLLLKSILLIVLLNITLSFAQTPPAGTMSLVGNVLTTLRSSSDFDSSQTVDNSFINKEGAWCSANPTSQTEYVQVGTPFAPMEIMAVSLQGRSNVNDHWVKKFKVSYSLDGTTFTYLPQIFDGTTGPNVIVTRVISPSIMAKVVRLHPFEIQGPNMCLRWDVHAKIPVA
eukprot:gene8643-10640_t